MKQIIVQKKQVKLREFVKRTALKNDSMIFINEPCLVIENGKPIISYSYLPNELLNDIEFAVKNISYQKNTRTSGLKTLSRIFGYNPRNSIRKNFCSATSLAYENPLEHAIISSYSKVISKLYKRDFPEIYERHKQLTEEKTKPEWRLPCGLFTSGIVNKNNPLKYHFDTGNYTGVCSNMLVLKNKIDGGWLSLPEYDLMFELKNGSVLIFDGQSILHGVTPIKKLTQTSYRYSIVYYSLLAIWNCQTVTEEIALARQKHFLKEHNRAKGKIKNSDLQWSRS